MINQVLASADLPKAQGVAGLAPSAATDDVTYHISREVATHLIGSAGATIKQLRASSGAKIQVENALLGEPGAQYQVLRLGGMEVQVQVATKLINEMLTAPLGSDPAASSVKSMALGDALVEYDFFVTVAQARKMIGPKG